jgi:hypothetical protein
VNTFKLKTIYFALVVIGVFQGCKGPIILRSEKLSHSTNHNGISLSVSFDSETKHGPVARVELINKSKYPIRCFFAYSAHPDVWMQLRTKGGSIVQSTPEGKRVTDRGTAGYSPLSMSYIVPNSSRWWNIYLSNYFILPKEDLFLNVELPINGSYSEVYQLHQNKSDILATPEKPNLNANGFILKLTNLPVSGSQ